MTTFREATQRREPGRTVLVPPSAFAETWEGRPSSSVCMGIRSVSASDVFVARAEASKKAWQAHPHEADNIARIEAYNDSLMRWIVARGTCDPNNVAEPAPCFEAGPEDIVFDALTPAGARLLFDHVEAWMAETDPTQIEADDGELASLSERIACANLPRVEMLRVRRLAGAMLDILAQHEVDVTVEDGAPVDG